MLTRFFNVDGEKNIPASFSTLLLLGASVLLGRISFMQFRRKAPFTHWLVLSVGFLMMAIDEFLSFHERLMKPVKTLLNVEDVAIFRHAWVIPAALLILLLIPYFWNFMRQLPTRTARMFIIAASLYLGGALGIEVIGGYYASTQGFDFMYKMIATVEESLEMAGVILFIHELMIFIGDSKNWQTKQSENKIAAESSSEFAG
ncbi:hypothetical protein NIES208_11065 [[Limnothrix rosea] IAM M-220]|nr:hypothetical protein NIES208_11065 [[Limnothrix rosea] IAM M-220]